MTIRYPWPRYASPLHCAVTDVRLDGQPLREDLVDAAHQRLRLDHTSAWSRFDCRITVTAREPIPEGVDDPLDYALIASAPTNTRLPFVLGPGEGTSRTGQVTLARVAVAGAFTIQAETGAIVAGRHRVIGSSEPWTVVLDRRQAPIPPGAPPFDITWIDFTAADAPAAAQAAPAAHALMVDVATEPRLLLNDGIEGLRVILDNRTAQKERRRTRDVLAASIARYATTTLFRTAVAEITAYSDDGPPQPPQTALLRQTCEAVASQMPGVSDVDELYEQILAAADPAAVTELWQRVDPAIDAITNNADALSAAAREVARG